MGRVIESKLTKEAVRWNLFLLCCLPVAIGGAGLYFVAFEIDEWTPNACMAAGVAAGCFVVVLVVSLLVGRYIRKAPARRLVIDEDNETVTFEHLLVPNSFWPKPKEPRRACSFSDILNVHFMPNPRGPSGMTIVTKYGKAHITVEWSNFDEVHEILAEVSRGTPGAPIYDNPWFLLVIGVLVGGLLILLEVKFGWVDRWLSP